MGVDPSRPSLFSLARQYLKEKFRKPGNVYLGVVSRLDACVTGVVVLARTSKAARRLSKQFRDREVRKLYWALVPQPPDPMAADLVDWLRKDDRLRKMLVCGAHTPGAVEARLSYRMLRNWTRQFCSKSLCRPVANTRFVSSWPRAAAYPGRSPIWQSLRLPGRNRVARAATELRPSSAPDPDRTCRPRSTYMASIRRAIVLGRRSALPAPIVALRWWRLYRRCHGRTRNGTAVTWRGAHTQVKLVKDP